VHRARVRSDRALPGDRVPRRARTACARALCESPRREVRRGARRRLALRAARPGERPETESELRLLVLLRHSSRSDRVTALELLWQAALAKQANESYFAIRVADRASAERRRAIDDSSRVRSSLTGTFCLPAGPPPLRAAAPRGGRRRRRTSATEGSRDSPSRPCRTAPCPGCRARLCDRSVRPCSSARWCAPRGFRSGSCRLHQNPERFTNSRSFSFPPEGSGWPSRRSRASKS
jgi:hypothetical protein